jgi:serine/threonine protein kinase
MSRRHFQWLKNLPAQVTFLSDSKRSIIYCFLMGSVVDSLHTTGGVKLLHYGFIKYNKKDKLGAGSFSNVYVGKYRGIPVAIKLLLTIDLTPQVIGRCVNEAQILSRIKHRNVVCCLGVSVLPPR